MLSITLAASSVLLLYCCYRLTCPTAYPFSAVPFLMTVCAGVSKRSEGGDGGEEEAKRGGWLGGAGSRRAPILIVAAIVAAGVVDGVARTVNALLLSLPSLAPCACFRAPPSPRACTPPSAVIAVIPARVSRNARGLGDMDVLDFAASRACVVG